MRIEAAMRIQTPARVLEAVKPKDGPSFQLLLEKARCCVECGKDVPTYQEGKCRECLRPSLKRGTVEINRWRGV